MVKSISNVSFGKTGVLDKISQEQLSSPGAYSKNYLPPSPTLPPPYSSPTKSQQPQHYYKEDSGFLGFLAKVVVLAAVICGGSVLARKYVPSLSKINLSEELAKDAKPMEKAKYYFAKFADWLKENSIDLFKKSK